MKCVIQEWVFDLPMMQQTVLLTAIRGPDGLPKYGAVKMLLRWLRRCILLSSMERKVLELPYELGGGSFTGRSYDLNTEADNWDCWEAEMNKIVSNYLRSLDAIPHHFQLHFMHAVEILGYKHHNDRVRNWWNTVYIRLVRDMHLYPESKEQLDERLSDTYEGWLKHADDATTA